MRVAALEQGLRDLGLGRQPQPPHRLSLDDRRSRPLARRRAAAVVAAAPDVIIANSTPVLWELRKQSTTLPMVFVQVTDPLGSGFVPNLARPGGNLTGFTNFEFAISGKWLQTAQGGRAGGQADRSHVQSADRALWLQALAASRSRSPRGPLRSQLMAAPSGRDVSAIEAAVAAFAHRSDGGLIVLVGR